MKSFILILTLCFSSWLFADSPDASKAATHWLSTIDSGKYKDSWSNTGAFFKSQVTQGEWHKTLNGVRAPLGPLISRTQITSKAYNTLPGVPDGEYVIVQFKTQFEHKKTAIETLTLSKNEGQWQPVGYFIK